MKRRGATTSAILLSAAALTALTGARLPALARTAPGPIGGHAMFTVQSWGSAHNLAAASVPTWTGSFTYSATTYTYQMAGRIRLPGQRQRPFRPKSCR